MIEPFIDVIIYLNALLRLFRLLLTLHTQLLVLKYTVNRRDTDEDIQ